MSQSGQENRQNAATAAAPPGGMATLQAAAEQLKAEQWKLLSKEWENYTKKRIQEKIWKSLKFVETGTLIPDDGDIMTAILTNGPKQFTPDEQIKYVEYVRTNFVRILGLCRDDTKKGLTVNVEKGKCFLGVM